jgi:hypothetical protein
MRAGAKRLHEAARLQAAGRPAEAAHLCEQILESEPGNATVLCLLGIARDRLGDKPGSIAALRRAIAIDDKAYAARDLLCHALMPGAGYVEVLEKIHGWLRPANYVEIGVGTGRTLALAGPETRAIGIDPAPIVNAAIGAGTKVFALTSDDFFARYDLAAEIGQASVALAFIDGLHLFEQALRDFINLERYAGAGSLFLVHDCLPLDAASASRDQQSFFWTGDVWKLIAALRQWRPDLTILTVAARPSGLAMITGLDPASNVLCENFAPIVAEFMPMPAPIERGEQERLLGRVDNDPVEIERYLRSLAGTARGGRPGLQSPLRMRSTNWPTVGTKPLA